MDVNFSSRLSEAIKKHGASKRSVAQAVGVQPPALSRWLAGAMPEARHLTSLASVLNVDVNWLMGGSSPKNQTELVEAAAADIPAKAIKPQWVPLISWAHAGEAVSYEELPRHWQELVPTTCKAKDAFALAIEGDSMQPYCCDGDLAIVMPHELPRNGKLAVAKLKNEGVVLRRYAAAKDIVRLTPHNPAYPQADYHISDFHWIYPVHSLVKREWD